MALVRKVTDFLEKIPRKKLFFFIAIYLLIAISIWHLGMDIYYGKFNLIFRNSVAEHIANNIVEMGTFSIDGINPTGVAAPIYCLFVASLMKLFGSSYEWVLVAVQIFLAIIIGFFIFKITERLFQSRIAGLISIILYSAHAELAYSFAFSLKEIGLFSFFMVMFVWVLMKDKLGKKEFIIAAIITGLAALTRPTGVVLFGILGLWIFYYSWKNKIKFFSMIKQYIIPVTFIFLMLVAPWLVYESYALDSLILTTSTTSGHNLLYGNNPVSDKNYPLLDTEDIGLAVDNILNKKGLVKHVDEIERDKYKKKLAVAYIKEYPGKFLKMSLKKLFAFYSPLSTPMGHGDRVKVDGEIKVENFKLGAINVVYFPFMLILYSGIIYFFIYRNKIKNRLKNKVKTNFFKIVFLTLLVFTLSHMIIYAESRHRYPFDPLLIIIAAGGFYYLLDKIRRRKNNSKQN